MMTFEHGKLNKDFYEVKLCSVGISGEMEFFKISQDMMKHFITKLSEFIHATCGRDIYICDEDIIDLNFIVKNPFDMPSAKVDFKIGLGLSDGNAKLDIKDYNMYKALLLLKEYNDCNSISVSITGRNNKNHH